MSEMLVAEGSESTIITAEDFGPNGEIKTKAAEVALVVQSFTKASEWLSSKQWNLTWRDSDVLYAAARAQETFPGSGVPEPSVTRWTVAKVVQSIVPKLHKGLFYENPPLQIRARPGTNIDTVRAKQELFSYLLDSCDFKTESELALHQFVLLGTTIVKWGYKRCEETVVTRKPAQTGIPGAAGQTTTITTDEEPKLDERKVIRTYPTFEFCDLRNVFVDPKCERGDIRFADWAVHQKYMDYYSIMELKDDPEWDIPENVLEVWTGPGQTAGNGEVAPAPTSVEQTTNVQSVVHHSMDQNLESSPDPLRKKLEVLEYWDGQRVIAILNRKVPIRSKENKFKKVPFYSANWWSRPKAFYGIGVGEIVGPNQRVDSGTINAILRILSFAANPTYTRKRDSSAPTQMIRTGIGRIITVDGNANEAFDLLKTPQVDGNLWTALKESQQATEESSGADAMLVQGNTAGGRTSMGRTAGGAGILSDAADSRLEGPLNRFINQIFIPFIYQLDEFIKRYMTDAEIQEILGDRMGKDAKVDMADFFGTLGNTQYEVLAGASLAAKRAMAQSILMMSQFLMNPEILGQLAEVNHTYVDFGEFEKMINEVSGWKNYYSIFKPLTPAMEQQQQQKQQANNKMAGQMQLQNQKFGQTMQRDEVQNQQRIQRDLVRESAKHTMTGSEDTEGITE